MRQLIFCAAPSPTYPYKNKCLSVEEFYLKTKEPSIHINNYTKQREGRCMKKK
jgi:hypothetical protein